MHRLVTFICALALFTAGYALGMGEGRAQAQTDLPTVSPETAVTFAPLFEAYDLIESGYVSPDGAVFDPAALVDGAISGMVAALGDRYSYYLTAEEYAPFTQGVRRERVGIGAVVNTNADGEVYIRRVLPGSPAEVAGLQADDVILAVDGVTVRDQDDAVERVGGDEGTNVALSLRRRDPASGDDSFTLAILTRARVVEPSVLWRRLGSVGYVRLVQFSPNTRTELDAALAALSEAGALDGAILDLRHNSGGQLGALVGVGSAFLDEGTLLIERASGGREQVFTVDGSAVAPDLSLVVLVDERTQSAAEAVAGALHVYERATLVGETTFGKGTVQRVRQLVNGGGVRFTIAHWLLGDRSSIHEVGVVPDVPVAWDGRPTDDVAALDVAADPQLAAALALFGG